MVTSRAATVDAYLDELPDDRRAVVETVLETVRGAMPEGYREEMAFGMIGWVVPLERYPDTYNKQPLSYVSLAAQKNHYALYMMGAYQDSAQERLLREGFAAAGRKLDMGKCCVRFKRLDDLPLDVIARAVASTPPDAHIATYEASRPR